MNNSEEEIWKAHLDFEKLEVSTLGRVRTLDRVVKCGKNRTRLAKGRVLKPHDNGNGYLIASILVDGKWFSKRVHRLVAETFLSNPDNLPQVNHKDCNRKNNNVENLEWCDNSYNVRYREKYGKAKSKPVLAINLATLKVSQFQSQTEAGRVLGVSIGNINNVIKGRYKSAGGYWFTNADDNDADIINRKLHEIKYREVK